MKTIGLKSAVSLTVLIMSVLSLPPSVPGQTVMTDIEETSKFSLVPTEKGLIVFSREVRLKSYVDSKLFEKWINEYWNLEWQDLIPGFQSYITKSEPEKTLYTYFLIFNSKRMRNLNFSDSDQNIEWYRELIYYEPTKHLYDELFEFIEIDPFFTNIGWYESK